MTRSCRRWRLRAEGDQFVRLVCTLPRGHDWAGFGVGRPSTPHQSPRSPWKWFGPDGQRTGRTSWVRDWTCRGLLDGEARCGKALSAATEDGARVKRWRIWWPVGATVPEVLCPACGRPDPVTAGHCRDLERSLRPSG